ncbi:hypothetical protein TNCV_4218071 [Trichonephila clavipes]|nr:hypothetical protein TNCV_4218071 [Trichonephila clavipes]
MKQEMQLFDSTENPSPNIKVCDALKTIPPTSVEAERAFSAAGLFVTKLRTRLSDKRNLYFMKEICVPSFHDCTSNSLVMEMGCGSPVVNIQPWQACHEFDPSTTKDPPCRAAMHVKSVES